MVVDLPAEVVAACHDNLADLRIVDVDGQVIAFALRSAPAPTAAQQVLIEHAVTIVDVQRRQVQRPHAPPEYHEVIRLTAAVPHAAAQTWRLDVDSPLTAFVAHVDIQEEGRAQPLVQGASVFRLPKIPSEQRSVQLADWRGGALTLTVTGEGDYLQPRLHLNQTATVPAVGPMFVALPIQATARAAGRTVLDVARPRGITPDALQLTTSTPSLNRQVSVFDTAVGQPPRRVGGGLLFRVPAAAGTQSGAENLRTSIETVTGETLRVEIQDGDSPALSDVSVAALVRQPSLVFVAPTRRAYLYFGGGRVAAPHYDLQTLTGLDATAALPRATVGAIEVNDAYSATPALAFAMHAGAWVDTRLYSHRRAVTLLPSAEGLAAIAFDPTDVAVARADLADVRMVDSTGHQWPYLVVQPDAPTWSPIAVEQVTSSTTETRYALALPPQGMRLDQLALDTPTAFLDRDVRLVGADDAVLARAHWTKRQDAPEQAVYLALAPRGYQTLAVVIANGSDAPLDVTLRGRARLPRLFVPAPAGTYSLLLGNPNDVAPHYELEQVRDLVLTVHPTLAQTDLLTSNPQYRGWAQSANLPRVALWGALATAVLVLGALVLRLVR